MVTKGISERLEGDKLLDALDLIEEIKRVGGVVSEDGMVMVYHRTSQNNVDAIYKTGIMKAKEDGLFFSTKENGYNDGYGDAVIKLSIPVENLALEDVFDNEVHLRLPLGRSRSLNVSNMLRGKEATVDIGLKRKKNMKKNRRKELVL